jgi:hypothetical protein
VVAVSLIYITNDRSLPLGTSERSIALMALVLWLFIPWAWWIDSTRRTVR